MTCSAYSPESSNKDWIHPFVLSCPILSGPVLSCPVLSYLVMCCPFPALIQKPTWSTPWSPHHKSVQSQQWLAPNHNNYPWGSERGSEHNQGPSEHHHHQNIIRVHQNIITIRTSSGPIRITKFKQFRVLCCKKKLPWVLIVLMSGEGKV